MLDVTYTVNPRSQHGSTTKPENINVKISKRK